MSRVLSSLTFRGAWLAGAVVGCMFVGGGLADRALAADPAPLNLAPSGHGKPEWPLNTGPLGNNVAARYGQPIVDDLILARLAWVSKPVLGKVRTAPNQKFPPGSGASPIVADGKVFVATYRPTGDAVVPNYANRHGKSKEGDPVSLILADDVLVAFDAANGNVLWEAREPGGVNRPGFKRLDFSPAAAYLDGLVYSVGTTGRVFAYDAATGQKKWESDIGKPHQAMVAARDKAVAAHVHSEDGTDCLGSPIAVAGTLIVPDFGKAYGHSGLVGFDARTGQRKWYAQSVGDSMVTPVVVRIDGKPYLLACNNYNKGKITCLDPVTGQILWKIDGIGVCKMIPASDRTVMVNIGSSKPRAGERGARWGAYRFDAKGARLAWSLPDDPAYDWSPIGDDAARRKVAVRDGLVLIDDLGGKADRRFVIAREEDGRILFEKRADANKMESTYPFMGCPRLIEDRLLIAADEAHGGSKLPVAFSMWKVTAESIVPMSQNWEPMVKPATTYEVLLEWPYVDGFLYSRTIDGAIACYDLRKTAQHYERADLGLVNAYRGSILAPLPMRLYFGDGKLLSQGSNYPPDEKTAGLILGKDRRFTRWEHVFLRDIKANADTVTASCTVDHGTGEWPLDLKLTREGDRFTGTWSRTVPGLPTPVKAEGQITGKGRMPERMVFTPWLPDHPWTSMGKNPDGTTTWMIQLNGLMKFAVGEKNPGDFRLYIDYDGKKITRSLGTALSANTAWHECDASGLTIQGDTIKGKLEICLNRDQFVSFSPAGGSLGAVVDLDLKINADNGLTGTYTGTIGHELTWSGEVGGKSVPMQ